MQTDLASAAGPPASQDEQITSALLPSAAATQPSTQSDALPPALATVAAAAVTAALNCLSALAVHVNDGMYSLMAFSPIRTWLEETNWLETTQLCGRGGEGRGFKNHLASPSSPIVPVSGTSLWLPFRLGSWPMQGHGADSRCVNVSQSVSGRQQRMGCSDRKWEVWRLVAHLRVKSWKCLQSIFKSFRRTESVNVSSAFFLLSLCFLMCLSQMESEQIWRKNN